MTVTLALTGGLAYAFWPLQDSPGEPTPIKGVASLGESTNASTAGDAESVPQNDDSPVESEDARMTRLIVGRWETQRDSGHRDMIVKDDGTATIHVTIESLLGRAVFGTDELDLEIEWRIEDGMLHFTTTGGKPKPAIEFLKKSYGESVKYPIIECTESRLLVREGDGEPDHDWARVKQ